MALKPASAPPEKKKLKVTLMEIERDGKSGEWYLVSEYAIKTTARTTAYTLRKDYPNLVIKAYEGQVLARKKELNEQ